MLKHLPKVVLLGALLTALVVSGAPTLASQGCTCFSSKPHGVGGCAFNKEKLQCLNTGCKGSCI
jgi:hypothetical protein